MPYNNASDPEMITKSAAVAEAFTPEKYAYLLSLLPTPESYAELHDRFEASYAAALKGDPEKVKACEADRNAVKENLTILQGLARAVTAKDPNLPETLGFGHSAERKMGTASSLAPPQGFKVIYDPHGQIVASVTKLAGAKAYEVWVCDGDPNVEGNWRLVAASANCRRIVLPGLNHAKTNWLKVRGMRGNSAGPWSNYVSLTPA